MLPRLKMLTWLLLFSDMIEFQGFHILFASLRQPFALFLESKAKNKKTEFFLLLTLTKALTLYQTNESVHFKKTPSPIFPCFMSLYIVYYQENKKDLCELFAFQIYLCSNTEH